MQSGRGADLSLHHEGPVHAEVVHHSIHIHRVLHLHLLDQPVDGDERPRPPDASAATTPTACLCFLSAHCWSHKNPGKPGWCLLLLQRHRGVALTTTKRGFSALHVHRIIYIQAVERTSFPAHFFTLGEMLCSYDILYPFLCYLQSTTSFWSMGQRF